jgi:hypothetical protein
MGRDDLALTVAITLSVDKVLTQLEMDRCNAIGVIMDKPFYFRTVCNLINGHTAEMHSDGASEWSD